MLQNYFKVAFRNLARHRFYSFINIFGLTIGIAVSMLIAFYVIDELSYDKFHVDAERIHQIYLRAMLQGKPVEGANTCAPIAAASREELSGVEDATRIALWRGQVFRQGENIYTEDRLLVADSNFFNFFTFELLEGNQNDILNEPNQIVLTEKTAKKYFGYEIGDTDSPVGKSLLWGADKTNVEIAGIAADPPQNAHFHFDMLLSMETWDFSHRTQWTSNSLYSYVKLVPGADPAEVEKSMLAMSDKYVGPEIEMFTGMNLKDWRETGSGDYAYYMQPMLDIRLHNRTDGNIEGTGDIAYVYLLSLVSIFIIVIACINFMNLATARSAGRAKEVGIRKTVGAEKKRLVMQFLLESVIISAISMLLAVGVLYLAIPFFNQITEKSIVFGSALSGAAIFGLIGVVFLVGLLAGSYPAFYLTSFKPTEVLKGKIRQGAKGGWIRSSLVVFQFFISVFLIVCTLVIYKQLKMVQDKNLGYDKENILIIDNIRTLGDDKQAFKEKLKALTGVQEVSISNFVPPHVYSNSVYFPNGKQEEGILFHQIYADHDYLKTLGLKMHLGRFFSRDFPSDSSAVIINKKGMEAVGWTTYEGNKIGQPTEDENIEMHEVVGIIDDFNFSSLKSEIEPLIIHLADWGNLMPVRLTEGNINDKIKEIEDGWAEMAPGEPFDYSFLDENFEAQFREEQQLGEIFVLFTTLAILIACLGLFGLATFIAEQRSKEIGIRKAMGASVGNVVVLLTSEFAKLVVIAIALSIAPVILLMNWWLEHFAFKTDIGILTFVIGGSAALAIAVLTVSYQSIKAAIANPTNALRYE
jgi:putative ABC transport system permease protein